MTNIEFLKQTSKEFNKFSDVLYKLFYFKIRLKNHLLEALNKNLFFCLKVYDFECDRDFIEKAENENNFFLRFYIGEQELLKVNEFSLNNNELSSKNLKSFKFGKIKIIFYFAGTAFDKKPELEKIIKKTLDDFLKQEKRCAGMDLTEG